MGDTPELRGVVTLSASAPLLPVQAAWGADEPIEMVVLCEADTPVLPSQLIVKVVELVNASVDCEPLVASEPDQPPEAVQDVALVEDQVRVALLPLGTSFRSAVRITLGTSLASFSTVTVVVCVVLPPEPEHVRVYCEVEFSGPVACEPEIASAPLHAPEAEQLVA